MRVSPGANPSNAYPPTLTLINRNVGNPTAAVILRVISLVNSPDLLLVLTGGGPGNATQVLSLYAFQTAYREFNFGYAGALSVVMFAILMVFATLYIRFTQVTKE